MRCDQYVGLNAWARETVLAKQSVIEEVVRHYPDGRQEKFDRQIEVLVATRESIGTIKGAWDDVVARLDRYTLPTGQVYQEFVQAAPWSSGPCYFIALKDAAGNVVPESEWTEAEIDQYTGCAVVEFDSTGDGEVDPECTCSEEGTCDHCIEIMIQGLESH